MADYSPFRDFGGVFLHTESSFRSLLSGDHVTWAHLSARGLKSGATQSYCNQKWEVCDQELP